MQKGNNNKSINMIKKKMIEKKINEKPYVL